MLEMHIQHFKFFFKIKSNVKWQLLFQLKLMVPVKSSGDMSNFNQDKYVRRKYEHIKKLL